MGFKKLVKLCALILVTSQMVTCTNGIKDGAEVTIDIPAVTSTAQNHKLSAQSVTYVPYAPDTVSEFECLFVNVVGPDIGDWNSYKSSVSLTKNFSYIGTFSKLVATNNGATVTVRVKRGKSRFIQLIGARSTVGCPATVTAADLADFTKFPGLFIIADDVKDVFRTTDVTLNSDYSPNSTSDIRGTEAAPNPTVPDTAVPSPGDGDPELTEASVGSTSVQLTWAPAADLGTRTTMLSYSVYQTTDPSLVTPAAIEASGDAVTVDQENLSSINITSLSPSTTYRFVVVVTDRDGNKAYYDIKEITTAASGPGCSCPAGQYLDGSTCTVAEAGYYASSCVRTACSNTKPSQASYVGTGMTSNSCPWTCNNGYIPNADYTSCVANTSSNIFPVSCPAGQVAVGLQLSTDANPYLTKMGAQCRALTDGNVTGSIIQSAQYGTAGTASYSPVCDAGYAIYKIEAGNFDGIIPQGLKFWCRRVSDGDTSSAPDSVPADGYFGGSPVGLTTMTCNAPYYLSWFTIGSAGAPAGAFTFDYNCKSTVSTTGLVGYWQLDNNGSDQVSPGNALTASGTVGYSSVNKLYGSHAASFSGAGYLDAGSTILNGLTDYSIVGWVKYTSRPSGKVSFWGQTGLIEFGFDNTGEDLCIKFGTASDSCTDSFVMDINKWYHIVITVKVTAGVGTVAKLYVNGSLETTKSIGSEATTSATNFRIGGGVWGTGGGSSYFTGLVDDLMVYNKVLEQADVTQVYGGVDPNIP